MGAHQQSRIHQAAALYLSGLNVMENAATSTTSLVKDGKFQPPRQRTIIEALKIVKPDTQNSECLHFFESFRDGCSIRKVSTKTLFERER